jgi:hypothetical protein
MGAKSAMKTLAKMLLVVPLLAPISLAASVFDKPELRTTASPPEARQITLPAGVRVVDSDVSPAGPTAALLVLQAAGTREILFWDLRQPQTTKGWDVPVGFTARSLVWHPEGNALFVAGAQGAKYVIFKVEQAGGKWTARQIYSSMQEIRRLVAGPRPFVLESPAPPAREVQAYRLFFGLKGSGGNYTIHSITEDGKREYQAIGPAATQTKTLDDEYPPSNISAASALPVGFHPAGHILLWEDARNCFQAAGYHRDHWEKTARLFGREFCGGTVGATPNGAGILHWEAGKDGVEILLNRGATRKHDAAGYQLVAAPSSVPDGRGIVGITRKEAGLAVNYIPIDVPLADVVNAWMYYESEGDLSLLSRHGGLFRDLREADQLYPLYDSELYQCGGFDESSPTRPYMVTTDSFWELFAAAYEGIFIVRERQSAMPAFWDFVTRAHGALRQARPLSRWTGVFAALAALQGHPESDAQSNPEAQRIARADGRHASTVLGSDFDYAELKPRGHYTATPSARTYFQAFRYLTRVSALNWPMDDLRQLPAEVKDAALGWIGVYADMIAPSRSPLLWAASPSAAPRYVKRPSTVPVLFPLSWGFDNETLFSTIYQADLPDAERIEGRVTPSSLDVAAALGSRFARELLAGEIAKYPRLGAALDDLEARRGADGDAHPTLYDRWIDGLAQQWADSVASPNGPWDEKLWRTKRLQTGLASWATLRHATVLVNERVSAECGEGGFEAILMRPPRGYVEPDPETFSRIAGLFEAAAQLVGSAGTELAGVLPDESADGGPAREALKQGLLRRLSETAAKARLFQAMAAKEVRGETLTAAEYEEILYFGRVAEHHFLIFKSLANKDLALSTPNPIPKIADVSDVQGGAPYLLAGVGRPLEWDHTVPYYGRREMVKGAAYSFYELVSGTLLDDQDWLKKLPTQARPAWVAPYVSANKLSCPARNPF